MELKNYVKQNSTWEEKAEKLYEAQKLKLYYSKLSLKLMADLLESSEKKKSKGKTFVFHYSYKAGTIDYKSIPELASIDLNAYRKDDIKVWKLENIGVSVLNKMEE